MIVLGIDPGVESGALAAVRLDGSFAAAIDAPWLAAGAKGRKWPDGKAMSDILVDLMSRIGSVQRCYLEEIRPHGGTVGKPCPACKRGKPRLNALAVASMASSFHAWRVLLETASVPFEVASPKTWRRIVELPTVAGQSAIEKRDAVLARARALWPDAPLTRKKDNGRAAALLIAEACRRVVVGSA